MKGVGFFMPTDAPNQPQSDQKMSLGFVIMMFALTLGGLYLLLTTYNFLTRQEQTGIVVITDALTSFVYNNFGKQGVVISNLLFTIACAVIAFRSLCSYLVERQKHHASTDVSSEV
jgi:cation transport ATPase